MKNFLLFDLFILFEYYFIEICCKNKIKADKNNNILLNKNYYNNYYDNNILKNIFFDINNDLNILSEDNNSINYMQNSEEEEDSSSSEEYIFNIPVYLEEDTKIKFFYQNENISLNLSTNPKEINIENLNNFIDNFKDIFEEKFKNIKNLILNLSDSNYSLNSFNSNNIDYIKKEENFIIFESKKFNNFDLSLELNGIIFEDPVFYLSYCPENFVNNKTYIDLLSYYSIFPKVFFDYFFNNFFNSKDECINSTYDNVTKKLGIYESGNPSSIKIYPKDYDSKQKIVDLIKKYNKEKKANNQSDLVINYSDDMKNLVSGITSVINVISFVLIGFVAISLIVSSIMIAIITYISVLERTKEIGILRAIGASKKDIKRVFRSETIIEGFIAGTLGVFIAFLITLPINLTVDMLAKIKNIAIIPLGSGIILILLSIVLNVIAGSHPSNMAAKKDPVEALRSE